MALFDTTWYHNYGNGSSTGWWAVTAWSAGAAKSVGALVRQTAPSAGNARVFVCIVAGTTHATTQPTWTTTRGAKTTDNTVTWQEVTGQPAMNGDVTNTTVWTTVKQLAVSLGVIVKNVAATHYFICSTAGTGTASSEPSWNTTAGQTTTDNTITWTCLGAVGNFSAWGAPAQRLADLAATNWAANSTRAQTIFTASTSAETTSGAYTAAFGSGPDTPVYIYSASTASAPPTSVTSGSTHTNTGNANTTISGCTHYEGMTFVVGSGATGGNLITGAAGNLIKLRDCAIQSLASTSGGITITIGASVVWDNVTLQGGTGTFTVTAAGNLAWMNTASPFPSTTPNPLFTLSSTATGIVTVDGVDLSGIGSGKYLATFNANSSGPVTFENCRLNASVSKVNAVGGPGADLLFIACDSGSKNYVNEKYNTQGTLTTETTIVRTGGFSDGVTPVSHKIVTTAAATYFGTFDSFPMMIWNELTSTNRTVTVYGIWGGGAVPNNDDIWLELFYLGNASYPLTTYVRGTKANTLASNSALSSDSSTWGGSTTAFKMTATFSSPQPLMKGLIWGVVRCAKASTTFYIDPVLYLS